MRTPFILLLLLIATPAAPGAQPMPPGQPMQPVPPKAVPLDSEIEALAVKAQGSDGSAARDAINKLLDLGAIAVPVLTQGLWAESSATRRTSAAALGAIGADARGAAPSLAKALNDDNKEVRFAAARALGSVGAHSAVPALTKALKDETAAVRLAAAESLINLGADAETVLPVLTKALKGREEEQHYAIRLLGELGPEGAPALIAMQEALNGADAPTMAYLAEAFGRVGPEAKNAMPTLKEKAKDDPNAALFRVPAAIALWRVTRDPDAAGLLRESLKARKTLRPLPHQALWRIDRSKETLAAFDEQSKSKDAQDMLLAADVLGKRAKDAVPELAKPLAALAGATKGQPPPGFDATTAERAAERVIPLLGAMGADAKAALEDLRVIAKAKAPGLSLAAAAAVYRIEPKPENALAITEYFENKDERLAAAEAIKQLRPTGQAVAIELLVALDSTDDEFRLAAAVALWRINQDKSALKAAVKSLRAPTARVREQAALALGGEFGPEAKTAVPDLVKRLFDSHAGVRSTTAEAIGRVGAGARDAAPALLTLIDGDEQPAFVQSAACEALGLIEPLEKDATVAALKAMLEHPGPLVRVHAALALARLGDKGGSEEATRGLTHRTHHVRITAAEAVWRINKDGRAIPLLVRALEESNLTGTESENERYMAARALGRIGADAKDASAELVKLLDARDEAVAAEARRALKLVDPEAAKTAGVK